MYIASMPTDGYGCQPKIIVCSSHWSKLVTAVANATSTGLIVSTSKDIAEVTHRRESRTRHTVVLLFVVYPKVECNSANYQ
jgi:hypothetical protein